MDQKSIAKQMLQFNKTAFDNTFNAMNMVYEQNEKMIGTFLDQAAWMPAEGKKAVRDWLATCKKGTEDFKKMVDEGYHKAAAFFEGGAE